MRLAVLGLLMSSISFGACAAEAPPQNIGMPGMEMGGAPSNPQPPAASGKNGGMASMPGMENMRGMTGMPSTGILGTYPMTRDASGTSWQPDLASHEGIHTMADDWMLMAHAMFWGVYDTQSGPRGDDKTFLSGMLMGAARRDFSGTDTLNVRAMLSPDPFMGPGGYPLLLATGETADGKTPLVDRQHPHDLVMELSGTWAHRFSPGDSAFLYVAYPGEPALGPPAFMHRASSMDIPQAPITHHWMDSTHIAFGVVTGGVVHDDWKLEVSQFTGREPDQFRYDFDTPRFDSTSVRLSWNPDEHWSLQTSWGHLISPEQLNPLLNENRTTASATWITRWGEEQSLAATLGWGLKQISDGTNLNGVLLESEYKPAEPWTVFARAEWEQNNELVPAATVEDVGEFTIGGIHDWKVAEHLKLGLGALYTFDFVPSLSPSYGSDPHGIMGFVRAVAE